MPLGRTSTFSGRCNDSQISQEGDFFSLSYWPVAAWPDLPDKRTVFVRAAK
jgi:hypothetical protein